ncbi:MAG: aromatic ring-hydroxylating dioxygenase subunit alpha [Alicyclobacillus sp.]|nr:aromatic ring-hydroxylating dioxygenase subunit alpha [Alicyclobacillus sp.]
MTVSASLGSRADTVNRTELVQWLRDTVRPEEGRIPAYIFSHPAVHALEMEHIFLKTWLFLGHQSELPRPGDYVTRELGGHSVIVQRGQDGTIRTFLNMCRHRGMRICRADRGCQSTFTCPYHGFTYDDHGRLIGVPYQKDAYVNGLDKSGMGLIEARTELYGSLIFATWNDEAPALEEFLGDMRWYLDLVANRADMEVIGPPQRWFVNATWKLAADNFVHDSYHTMFTHASIAKLGMVPSADYSKYGYQIDCGRGHGLNLGTPSPEFIFPETLREEYRAHLSPSQFGVLEQMKNMIGNVFPNLSFLISSTKFKGQVISNTTLRLWQPKGPGRMEIWAWMLVEKNAPEEWKRLSRQVSVLTFSPSGIFEQDDTENFVDITANAGGPLAVQKDISFVYVSGMGREPVTDFPGPGKAYSGKFSEITARSFYRAWLDMMVAAG